MRVMINIQAKKRACYSQFYAGIRVLIKLQQLSKLEFEE